MRLLQAPRVSALFFFPSIPRWPSCRRLAQDKEASFARRQSCEEFALLAMGKKKKSHRRPVRKRSVTNPPARASVVWAQGRNEGRVLPDTICWTSSAGKRRRRRVGQAMMWSSANWHSAALPPSWPRGARSDGEAGVQARPRWPLRAGASERHPRSAGEGTALSHFGCVAAPCAAERGAPQVPPLWCSGQSRFVERFTCPRGVGRANS